MWGHMVTLQPNGKHKHTHFVSQYKAIQKQSDMSFNYKAVNVRIKRDRRRWMNYSVWCGDICASTPVGVCVFFHVMGGLLCLHLTAPAVTGHTGPSWHHRVHDVRVCAQGRKKIEKRRRMRDIVPLCVTSLYAQALFLSFFVCLLHCIMWKCVLLLTIIKCCNCVPLSQSVDTHRNGGH